MIIPVIAPPSTADNTNASNITSGTLNGNRLPQPSTGILGGVLASNAVANEFVTNISTTGAPVLGVLPVANTTTNGVGRQATTAEAQAGATAGSTPAFMTPEDVVAYISSLGLTTSITIGSGTPSSGSGQNGEYFLDISTGKIWGPKASGAWPGSASYVPKATLASLTDVLVSEGAGINGYTLNWNNSASKWEPVAPVSGGGSATLSGLSDVNVTEGAGINGYTLNWNNSTSKWVATAPVSGGGSSTLASLTDVNVTESSAIDGYYLTYNNATSKWIATGSGAGSVPVLTPPVAANLTAVTNLGSATLTNISTTGIPALLVRPIGNTSSTLYCALQSMALSTFSLVSKSKTLMYNSTGGWNGTGLVLYNSANNNTIYLFCINSDPPGIFYSNGSGSFTSFSLSLGNPIEYIDFFFHLDFDGTNIVSSISLDGVTKIALYSETVSAHIGAITHVGIGWSCSGYSTGDGPLYGYFHYFAGTYGNNGITFAGSSGTTTLAADTDVSITSPANNQQLLYQSSSSKWTNENVPVAIAISITGLMLASEILLQYVVPLAFTIPSGATGSYAKANTAATGSTTVTINKNGTSIGTIVWSASGTSGSFTFSTTTSFAVGDILQLVAPGTADATLANTGITLAGYRS